MKAPCWGCQDRTVLPNCHISCRKYQLFATERERIRIARKKDQEIVAAIVEKVERRKKTAEKKLKG